MSEPDYKAMLLRVCAEFDAVREIEQYADVDRSEWFPDEIAEWYDAQPDRVAARKDRMRRELQREIDRQTGWIINCQRRLADDPVKAIEREIATARNRISFDQAKLEALDDE